MALVKCKECGEKVSTKAKTCPNCGAKAPKKTSLFTWLVLAFIVFTVFTAMQADLSLTPEQRKAMAEERALAEKAKAEAKAKKEKEDKLAGFHCLSSWDGSHTAVVSYVKKNLRDPDSFDHMETRITPLKENGTHTLVMKYRAKNGFGGMTIGEAVATIDNATCNATVLSVE